MTQKYLSLVHADWSEYDGKKVIAYQDDASRYILAMRECVALISILSMLSPPIHVEINFVGIQPNIVLGLYSIW